MTLISIEEAKTRLAECNVLLKYISFLQKNGLSDCGRGQIMGQASLLQEYLEEKEEQEKQRLATDESSQQQKEQQQQEKQQAITKDAEKTRTMIKATFHEADISNISKSDLLSQVRSVTSKSKVTTVEENNELAREELNKQTRQTLPQPIMSDITTSDSGSGVETNKQTDRSWINKIKKATDVENWRSWQ